MKPKSETKKKMRRRSTRHTTREIRARQDARSRQRLRWKTQRHDERNEKHRSLKGKNERTRKRRRNSKFFDFLEGALALTQEDFEATRDLHSEMSPNFFLACLRFGIAESDALKTFNIGVVFRDSRSGCLVSSLSSTRTHLPQNLIVPIEYDDDRIIVGVLYNVSISGGVWRCSRVEYIDENVLDANRFRGLHRGVTNRVLNDYLIPLANHHGISVDAIASRKSVVKMDYERLMRNTKWTRLPWPPSISKS